MYSGLSNIVNESNPHLGGNLDHGDPFTFSPSAWDYLLKRFSVRSALDLGSGTGHAAHYFSKSGVNCIAVDGLEENILSAIYPTIRVDLTKTSVFCKVDLVHCQEVVEHIEEIYVNNIVNSFKSGSIVCMTHAFPGQGGHHHVNEQPTQYWIDLLTNNNFSLLMEDTKRIREFAKQDGATYLARSGLVFANNN